MTTIHQPVAVAQGGEVNYVQWAPAIAGALAAASLAFVLHAFGAAIGLAVSSTAPTWRDASMALQLLSGLYLVFVAIVSLGVGGYIAGRMRTPVAAAEDEVEFRDGTHGTPGVGDRHHSHRNDDMGGGAVADADGGDRGTAGSIGRRRERHRF